jgi:hypothetical protein
MDPVCTLSLACNIMQVIGLGFELAKGCKEVYTSGSLSSNIDIEYVAAKIQCISDELERETATNASGDKEFRDLAIKCSATSRKLLSKLDGIKMKSQKGKCDAICTTISAMWNKRAIDGIRTQLESYQKVLETTMIKRLHDKVDLALLQQEHTFDTLDQDMQSIIQHLVDGHTRLVDLICEQADAGRLHIENELTVLKRTQSDEDHRKAVMDSLFFPEIHSRQESIKDAHKHTFQWIFDTGTQEARPWSNFPQWLQHDRGIYWISGKAGSGKSTLMNYLCAEQRTEDALKVWAGNRELLTPSFFFWYAGSIMQKSIRGLLCSLLYQILKQRPGLVSVVAERPIPTWTEKRLSKTLLSLIDQEVCNDAIFFLIDGLDEFVGEQQDLVDLIKDIDQKPNVKICVSSRPERAFEKSLGFSSQLKLEDLTRKDIENLVNDKLRNTPAAGLAKSLIGQANGVLLWVDLALKDVMLGVHNEDSFEELQSRLQRLPQELSDLYWHMLCRLDPFYRALAKVFLRLVLLRSQLKSNVREPTVLDFALVECDRTDAIIASSCQDSDIEYLVSACKKLKTQIPLRYAGLLEVDAPPLQEMPPPSQNIKKLGRQSSGDAKSIRSEVSSRVKFIHASAYEFLLHDERGKTFVSSAGSMDVHGVTQLFKAQLVRLRLLSQGPRSWHYGTLTEDLICLGRGIYSLGGGTEQLFDSMDHVLGEIQNISVKQTSQTTQDLSYWFTTNNSDLSHRVPIPLAQAKGPNGNQKPTFLGFAAWNGLIEYVCKKLEQLSQAEATETASRMLILVLISKSTYSHSKVRDSKQLFRYGADGGTIFTVSNMNYGQDHEMTGFKVFLELIVESSMNPTATKDRSIAGTHLLDQSSLLEEFLNQPVDPGIVVEVILSVRTELDGKINVRFDGKSLLMCRVRRCYNLGLVVLTPLALLLKDIPGSQTHKLPLGARENKIRRVTQIKHWKGFYDLSKTQADYLTDAYESWFEIRDSKSADENLAQVTMRNRLVEVCKEFGLQAQPEALSESL